MSSCVGEKAIFCEIDSFLPIKEEYEFLRSSSYRNHPELGEGFRIKTYKLRGQISQGLLIPLKILNVLLTSSDIEKLVEVENADVTEILRIMKWGSETCSFGGQQKGLFPDFLSKSKQERIQNIKRSKFADYFNHEWEITEKLDGSSMTVYRYQGESGVCSSNIELKLNDNQNKFVNVAIRDGLLRALEQLDLNVALQGELCGPGIQGNKCELKTEQFFLYDVWLIENSRYATREERYDILSKLNTPINHVPVILDKVSFESLRIRTRNCILDLAYGASALHKTHREGLVFKSHTVHNGYIPSFKVINNTFLLNEQ